jgi:pimeloyl-ACP methyl ester carboxylesterase
MGSLGRTADRDVVASDHRGHGRSQKSGATDRDSINRLAVDLIGLLETEVGRPVDLLGHSMGGAISVKVTLTRPDLVRSLVLMDTSAWSFLPLDESIAAMMGAFVQGFDPAGGLPGLTAMAGSGEPLIAASTPADWTAAVEQHLARANG